MHTSYPTTVQGRWGLDKKRREHTLCIQENYFSMTNSADLAYNIQYKL